MDRDRIRAELEKMAKPIDMSVDPTEWAVEVSRRVVLLGKLVLDLHDKIDPPEFEHGVDR